METKVWKCDGCGKLIEKERDVYKINMRGAEWYEGPPHSVCQLVKKLGFCDVCAVRIKWALETIADRLKIE